MNGEPGDNLGGDWFSRLGPAGTRRSLFIGEARSARCGDGCEPANLTSTGVRLSESNGDTAAEKPRPGAVGLDSRDSRDSRRRVEPSKSERRRPRTQSGQGAESNRKATSFRERRSNSQVCPRHCFGWENGKWPQCRPGSWTAFTRFCCGLAGRRQGVNWDGNSLSRRVAGCFCC